MKLKAIASMCKKSKRIMLIDVGTDEREIDPHGLRLIMGGSIVQPYATSDGGGIFVDTAALAPINDALDYLTLHERRSSSGSLYIAVKNGLVLHGILFPMQIEDMQLMSRLMELCDMVRTNILNTPEPHSDKEQMTFDGEG